MLKKHSGVDGKLTGNPKLIELLLELIFRHSASLPKNNETVYILKNKLWKYVRGLFEHAAILLLFKMINILKNADDSKVIDSEPFISFFNKSFI